MGKSNIDWTDYVWNPVTGCTPISAGCQNCYAKRMAETGLRGICGYPADDPFRVTLHPKRLNEPLKWKSPKTIFLCSMGDLFHEDVPFEYVTKIFKSMFAYIFDGSLTRHLYIWLTKRPDRMKEYLEHHAPVPAFSHQSFEQWKPPNLWLGVTAENQATADERIPILLDIPAAKHFVSVEPMLEPVNISKFIGPYSCLNCGYVGADITCNSHNGGDDTCPECNCHDEFGFLESDPYIFDGNNIGWVIAGAETGPGARPMNPDWARSLRDQCQAAEVPFFFKKMSNGAPIPEDLQIREWPNE